MTSTHYGDSKVAAVVIGGELNGLGVVRSLAQQRVPIIAVDTQANRAALWSRYSRRRVIRSFTGQEFVEDMINLGKAFDRPPVLLLTAEEAVHSVSENRAELSKWFRFRLPADEIIKLLSSKAQFHDFALRNAFPVPRTAILEDQSDIGLLDQLNFPCVMKPDDKRNVLSGHKERAVRVVSLSEARERASAMLRTPGGIVVQEWIEGPDSNIYFTLFYRGVDGHVVGIFTGRKIACYPRDVGSTAVCLAAPEARKVLEPMTLAFAEHAGFDGMGSMEYKWDNNQNKFFMVEPTVGRTDWQEEIATLCGVNLPVAAYRYELGLPVINSVSMPSPVAWRATLVDKGPPELLPARTRIVDGYFRWDDPLPALKFYCLDHPLQRIIRRWDKKERGPELEENGNATEKYERPTQ